MQGLNLIHVSKKCPGNKQGANATVAMLNTDPVFQKYSSFSTTMVYDNLNIFVVLESQT